MNTAVFSNLDALGQAISRAAPLMVTRPGLDKHPFRSTIPMRQRTADDVRRDLATIHKLAPEQVTDDMIALGQRAQVERVVALDAFVGPWLKQYHDLFVRLTLPPDQVEAYVRRERALLATLYFAVLEPTPSLHRVRKLAYQLALDARTPLREDLFHVEPRETANGWQLSLLDTPAARDYGVAPGGDIAALSPHARFVFEAVLPRLDVQSIMDWIELVFGRQPERRDTLEFLDVREFSYRIEDDGKLRLWIGAVEVQGIHRKDEQALLTFFCENPKLSLTGSELKKRLGKNAIKNPSQAAKNIKEALRVVLPDAGGWLQTAPYRWADGIQVRPTAANRRSRARGNKTR